MGWFIILTSILIFVINLTKNNNKTPKRRGSVGTNIPIPPKSKPSKLNERGVQKTFSNNNFSNEKKAKNTRIKMIGKNPSKKNSLAKKIVLSNTKDKVSNTSW